jgi:hypothetical protein
VEQHDQGKDPKWGTKGYSWDFLEIIGYDWEKGC